MLVACDISKKLKLLDKKVGERIEKLIKDIGLPDQIHGVSLKNIIKAHYYDKKFKGLKNRFVLIKDIGKTKIVENIPLKVIGEAAAGRIKK
jgi:3-dehydroquinate synthetase